MYPGGGPIAWIAAWLTTGGGVTVSTGGSPTSLVEVQPVTTMNHTAIHPNAVAERKLLAVLIRPLSRDFHCGLLACVSRHQRASPRVLPANVFLLRTPSRSREGSFCPSRPAGHRSYRLCCGAWAWSGRLACDSVGSPRRPAPSLCSFKIVARTNSDICVSAPILPKIL
jgi:hypothetical protein